MNDIEHYKEQAEYYKQRLNKVEEYHRNQHEQKKCASLTGGKLLMVIFVILIIVIPSQGYTFNKGVEEGIAVAGFIWGFVMWRQWKD